jgi:hypothetical protein
MVVRCTQSRACFVVIADEVAMGLINISFGISGYYEIRYWQV